MPSKLIPPLSHNGEKPDIKKRLKETLRRLCLARTQELKDLYLKSDPNRDWFLFEKMVGNTKPHKL